MNSAPFRVHIATENLGVIKLQLSDSTCHAVTGAGEVRLTQESIVRYYRGVISQGSRPERPRVRVGVLVPILAFIALVAWGFASPVGSSPDDDFHLASIWCGSGERLGLCEQAAQANERIVPKDLSAKAVCFATTPTVSASCQGKDFGASPTELRATARGNFTGLYPPVFYFVMSAFAGPNVDISVLLMRVVNSALFVTLVTSLFIALPRHRRTTVIGPAVISLVPLGMFLIPSTNPSSWAVMSATTVWIALFGYFESTGMRKVALAAIAVLGALAGAGARADSAAYVGVAVVVSVTLTFRANRRYFLAAALPASLLLAAIFFYLISHQSLAGSVGLPGSDGRLRQGGLHLGLLFSNLADIPGLWVGVFGSWALGWFDTKLPATVWVGGFTSFLVVIIFGLRSKFRRKTLMLIFLILALWLIPTAVLAMSGAAAGSYVQPRYLLPLVIIFAGVALLNSRDGELSISPPLLWTIASVLTITNSLSLYTNIRRYVTGTNGRSLSLDSNMEWWWNMPLTPMSVWAIGSIAFSGMLVLVVRSAVISSRRSVAAGATE